MSFKGKLVVLKRIRSGDDDLIAKVYSPAGVVSVLVREGYLGSNPFLGVFEPFNLVEADLDQKGDILVPNDIISVRRYSLLARDYNRYVWMSWVSLFVLTRISFYDERVFPLIVRYLTANPGRRIPVYRVLFRIGIMEALGWRPRFLSQNIGKGKVKVRISDGSVSEDGEVEVRAVVLRFIKNLAELGSGRISARGNVLKEAEDLLDRYIDYHTR
ncbi:MAG: recombination protein O N-terminal domain-containing protein [Aquificota bacterium]|nr:recombination protein O N-terminal domain-containing protein [Aquificota bacterium]